MADATRFVNTASTAGGDGTTNETTGATRAFATTAEAEAALPADITTGGDQGVWTIMCSGTAADTGHVWFNSITSAAYYLRIVGNFSGTTWDTSKYRLDLTGVAAGTGVRFSPASVGFYGRLENIQLKYSDAFNYAAVGVGLLGASDLRISNCLILGGTGTAHAKGILCDEFFGGLKVWNTIISGFTISGIEQATGAAQTTEVYNCTISGCGNGYTNTTGTATLKNVLFNTNTTDASGTIADTYCSTTNDNSKGLTSAATGNRFSQTFSFTSASDWSLTIADTGARGWGLVDPANGLFSDDIDGQSRGVVSWDIGADQYIASGRTSGPLPMALRS